jgi:hypothetical protein
MRLNIKVKLHNSNNAFEQIFPRCLFLSSIFVNVRIDCSNVNQANDIAQLFSKMGQEIKAGSLYGFKIQMLPKERPVDKKILNEGMNE